jgi:DNA-directed RNA polymerase subunit E'/Rpb7
MNTVIHRNVCLEPRFMDKNIMNHLLAKIKVSTRDECSKEHGYILDVKTVKIISNNISSANSDIVLKVEMVADTLKPKEGDIISGKVCMIFQSGIFVDISGKLKILIPLSELAGYELDGTSTHYARGMSEIKKDDIVKVKIKATKYDKRSFSCFGSLVD